MSESELTEMLELWRCHPELHELLRTLLDTPAPEPLPESA